MQSHSHGDDVLRRRRISWLIQSALLVGLLANSYHHAAAVQLHTQPVIRLGMFSLYRPQALLLEPRDDVTVWIEQDAQAYTWWLHAQSRLHLRHENGQLVATLYGANRHVQSVSCVTQLVSAFATWTITVDHHRLIRVVRGRLCLRIVNEAIQTVLETDRESVVARVVASEMSGVRHVEALKALAVVTRTFIEASQSRHRSQGYDFCDTTHCFWYQGEDRLNRRDRFASLVQSAVEQTRTELIQINGACRPTYFTGSCGGRTAKIEWIWGQSSSEKSWRNTPDDAKECSSLLGSVTDMSNASDDAHVSVSCRWCQGSAFDRWQRRLKKTVLFKTVSPLLGFVPSSRAEISIESQTHGFVRGWLIKEGGVEHRLAGETVRSLMGRHLGWQALPSHFFTIEEQDGWLLLKGRGLGHSVGLCLRGAIAQARAGYRHDRILFYYFPTAQLIVENKSGMTP